MTDDSLSPADETTGVLVAVRGPNVVVRLESGEEVLCRNVRRLHRPLGFHTVPYGSRVKIRYSPAGSRRIPLIVAVMNDATPNDADPKDAQ
jgi:hypothetical protein